MKSRQLLLAPILTAYCLVATHAADKEAERYWGQWRGPLSTGVAPHADPPVEWSETKNIRWKLSLPGVGHSTPIIWGDCVYVTSAVPYGDSVNPVGTHAPGAHDYVAPTQHHKFMVLAINRADGKIIWERTLREELPHESSRSNLSGPRRDHPDRPEQPCNGSDGVPAHGSSRALRLPTRSRRVNE